MASRLVSVPVLVVGAFLAAPPPARADDTPPATIVLNGTEVRADVIALEGDGSAPREDDLLNIGNWPGFSMMRGAGTTLRLRTDHGRWFEIADDGKETLVGLAVSDDGTISDGLLPPEDALAIPEAQFAALRGVAVQGRSERTGPILRRIDASRCSVNIAVGARRTMSALPDGLRALRIGRFPDDPADLRPLANQTKLRRLVVEGEAVRDWSPLAGMRELLHLDAEIRPPTAASVPELPSLLTYSANYGHEVTDISFVARFPALQVLDVHSTGVTDLTPIERLRDIREVDATMTEVAKLPAGKVPSLRKLRILRHRVPDAELRAFLDANPQCVTEHSWRAELDANIASVDAVRLRTGGQCHRNELEEDTLFESRDPKDVRELLAMIVIDEPASASHCMCCGGPTIELLRDGEIAASLTVHHDQGLRWGGWPGDGRLTEDAADALCAWLTRHGAPAESPRAKAKREAAETKARDAAQDEVVGGAERGGALRACKFPADVSKIARAAAPETDARIVLLLRLTSLGGGPRDEWGRTSASLAGAALREEDPARLAAVLLATLTDAATPRELLLAAAETVRDIDDDNSPFAKDDLAALRIPAARALIAHGDATGRYRAVQVLEKQATPESVALAVSLLPSVDEDGRPTAQPTPESLEVASYVALFCDETDLPRIQALAAASRDPKRWVEEIERQIARRAKRPAPGAAPR